MSDKSKGTNKKERAIIPITPFSRAAIVRPRQKADAHREMDLALRGKLKTNPGIAPSLNRIAIVFLFIGTLLAVGQLAYQTYLMMTIGVWQEFSALDAFTLSGIDLNPDRNKFLVLAFSKISLGVLLMIVSFITIVLLQAFIKPETA